jgi:cell division protein FtsN
MKLRDEHRIKDKVEFRVDTRHLVYLILWSVLFSAVIFYSGLVVGKKSNPLPSPVPQALASVPDPASAQTPEERLVRAMPLLKTLAVHPEQEEKTDEVLNAMARLRIETMERAEREDQALKAQLQQELFPPKPGKSPRPPSPDDVLRNTSGISAPARGLPQRLAEAPEMPLPQPEPEPVVTAKDEPPEPRPRSQSEALFRAFMSAAPPAAPAPEPAQVGLPEPPAGPAAAADPAPAPATGEPEALPRGQTKAYAIQAKSFRDKTEADVFADYLVKSLQASPYKAFIMPVDLPNKGRWYRVRIGQFPSLSDAQKFKEAFEKKEGMQTILVVL